MTFVVTMLASAALIAGAAYAQSTPAEIKIVDGVFTDKAGKPVYTFTNDTMRNMSHCEGRCAELWPPVVAAPDAKPIGDFYTVKRGGGVLQWAYKNHPLYTSSRDEAGKPATAANELWVIAKP